MELVALGFAALCIAACVVALLGVNEMAKANQRLLDLIGEQSRRGQDERREMVDRMQFPDKAPARDRTPGKVTSNMSPETRQAFAQVGRVATPRVTDGD